MSIMGASGGAFEVATAMYASHDGEWVEIPLGSGPGWTRPADWLPTSVTAGEQKVQMLVHIGVAGTPEPMRIAAISATGAFTVDWGDGTAPQNFASNADATHLYDPAALAGTLTSDGYLQALITVTPQAGQTLSTITPARAYYAGKNTRSNIVEVVAGPILTSLGLVATSMPILQRVEMLSPYRPLTLTTQFSSLASLREVVGTIECTATIANSMFSGCALLEKVSELTLSLPNVTSATSMFFGCAAMTLPPTLNMPSLTNAANMFQGCRALQEIPMGVNWGSVTTFSATFQECASLTETPTGFSAASAVNTPSMFQDCASLKYANVPTPAAINTQFMFTRCYSLRECALDTSATTSVSSMFASCGALEKITGLDCSHVSSVNLNGLFTGTNRLSTLNFVAGKGPAFSFTIAATNLIAADLNAVYAALPTVSGQTITVTGVPGTLGDDPTIATAKGWTVTGS